MVRRNPLVFLPFAAIGVIILISVISFSYFRPEEYDDEPLEVFDIFFYSSYYYPKSKSLGDNAVAVVFTADFDLPKSHTHLKFKVSSGDKAISVMAPIQRITPHHKCKWIDYSATFISLPSTGVPSVALDVGKQLVELPMVQPPSKYHDVVTCVAPLFASEQWQIALLAAHVYKRFGSHMHLYARSMVSPMFQLLKEYQKNGYITLQPWHRVVLKSVPEEDFDPNINVEFRNQGAAQTDCLLQYKETAAFISFVDLDDILIPRLHNTYFEEFEELFNSLPTAAFLQYNKENSRAIARRTGPEFSLTEMISTISFEQTTETGKLVTKPKYMNSTWIHWPPALPSGMRKHVVPSTVNAITHIKHFSRIPGKASIIFSHPLYNPIKNVKLEPDTLLTQEDVEAMEQDYKRISGPMKEVLNLLPEEFFYADIISDCYNKGFYSLFYTGQLNRVKCFGPGRCKLPKSPGIPCYNALADYQSHDGSLLNAHFAVSTRFGEQDGCIR